MKGYSTPSAPQIASSRLRWSVKGNGRAEMTTLELWDITAFASHFLASTSLPVL